MEQLSEQEGNHEFAKTLLLLKSTKKDAPQLLLNLLNQSISRKYGYHQQIVTHKNKVKNSHRKKGFHSRTLAKLHDVFLQSKKNEKESEDKAILIIDDEEYQRTEESQSKVQTLYYNWPDISYFDINEENGNANVCSVITSGSLRQKNITWNYTTTQKSDKAVNTNITGKLSPSKDAKQLSNLFPLHRTIEISPHKQITSKKVLPISKTIRTRRLHELSSRQRLEAILKKGLNARH